ncbi:hypothetical protein Bca52824_051523 [Brassica carinata]|uniref:En/Spm-like transposon protein n=2 Tax=Brassica TaxID=3705 RepID=A0A8X7R333_BRACI|nr:hypothetical protein Bca52824_051523 [Brassica carinata]
MSHNMILQRNCERNARKNIKSRKMSGNDYTRYLSAGSRKSYGSKKSSSRRSNPGSSSNSQMAESSAVPNSQTQPSPPAPAQASPPAPAPAQAPPAPAPSQAPPAPAPAQAPPPPAPNAAAMTLEDLAAINMILASPGHHLLPHLHPNRPPNTVWFDEDGSVAASVRQIFERDFKEPHASWKQTPGNVVRRWFESFAQMYHWDSGFTSLVRDSFEAKLKVQMNRQVCRWKKVWRVKGDAAMPVWFDPNVWAGLVTYWLDPGTEVRSCNSRAARYSDPDGHGPSKHRSGQTSYKARARIIAEETGESIPDLLGVLEITKRKPDGSFVDGKSEQLYNDVTSKFQELSQAASADPESTGSVGLTPAEKNKIYCELAPRKKGRIYGVGSLNQSVGSVSASFPSSSSSEDQSLKKIIKEQALVIQSQGNEIGRLSAPVRYLATKDSTLANILQSEDDESDAI